LQKSLQEVESVSVNQAWVEERLLTFSFSPWLKSSFLTLLMNEKAEINFKFQTNDLLVQKSKQH